jgi:Matrixin
VSRGRTARLAATSLVAVGCAASSAGAARAACHAGVEPHGDGSRTVTSCTPDGALADRRTVAVLELETGPAEKTISDVRPAPEGGTVEVDSTYGVPTDPRPPGLASLLDDSCSNSEYHLGGSPTGVPWAANGYRYYANLSHMPQGDTDRQQITKGKHVWDTTRAGCGFGDITNFTTTYAGPTRVTIHSYRDNMNVVDFGSLATFTTDPTAIAITSLWWDHGHLVEADTRFEQPPSIPAGTLSWSVSGNREAHKWDLWGMAAHESGHALGLGHATTSTDNWLTMSPVEYVNSIRWQDLGRGDVLGLRRLYP